MHRSVVGFGLDSLAEMDDGLVETAVLSQRPRVVAVGVGRTGRKGELLFKMRDRLIEAARGGEYDAEVGVRVRVVGVGADGLLEQRLRFVQGARSA